MLAAPATLLATGGYAALWERTTNPPGSVGDGIVLAYRAGAALADLEFVQFHPTVVAGNGLLLSEALRGEGALLLDEHGERFTDELAPRDVVARAIAEHGTALLDLRRSTASRFPTLMARSFRTASTPPRPDPRLAGGALLDGRRSSPTSTAARACRGSTPPASAPAPASTAPTGSPPTRCSSASSSAAEPRSPPCPTRRSPCNQVSQGTTRPGSTR